MCFFFFKEVFIILALVIIIPRVANPGVSEPFLIMSPDDSSYPNGQVLPAPGRRSVKPKAELLFKYIPLRVYNYNSKFR